METESECGEYMERELTPLLENRIKVSLIRFLCVRDIRKSVRN